MAFIQHTAVHASRMSNNFQHWSPVFEPPPPAPAAHVASFTRCRHCHTYSASLPLESHEGLQKSGTRQSSRPMSDLPVYPTLAAGSTSTARIEGDPYPFPLGIDCLPFDLPRTQVLMKGMCSITVTKNIAKKKGIKGWMDSPEGNTGMGEVLKVVPEIYGWVCLAFDTYDSVGRKGGTAHHFGA